MKKESTFAFRLQDGKIQYRVVDGDLAWEAPVERIVLMAEFTTDYGPIRDDYFLVFWTFEDQTLYRAEASFYSQGRDELIHDLSSHWKADFKLDLAPSTEYKSRVIWPPELAGHPYFTLEEIPPSGWRQTIRYRIFGPSYQRLPTHEVSDYLRRFKPDF